jgi:hypothetical protein
MKTRLTCAAALSIAAWANAAMAGSGSYTGNWKVELRHYEYPTTKGWVHGPNSSHCLVLSDDGSYGYTHSGGVLEDGQYFGDFQVIGRTIVIAVQAPGSNASIATWLFTTSASNGNIANKGVFNYDEGVSTGAANAIFGTKGSC